MMSKRELYLEWGIALAILITFSVGSWLLCATALLQGIDEGIYLEGGEKLLQGQMPYRDFFAFTGPLVYLVQAGLQYLFGPNLAAARWSVGLAFGILGVSGYSIVRRFASRDLALGAAFVQLLPHYLFYFRFHVGHRLLSMAFFCAVGGCLMAPGSSSWFRFFAAGVFAALSAWATPSFIVPLAALSIWMLLRERPRLLPWLAGIALCSLPFLIWLISNGALAALMNNLVWTTSRYSLANSVPYGYLIITKPTTEQLLYYLIPIFVPVTLAIAAFAIFKRKQWELGFLTFFALCFFVTLYPRWDVLQLCYILCPFVALSAILASRMLGDTAQRALFAAMLAFTSYRLARKMEHMNALVPMESRVGAQKAQEVDIAAMSKLESLIAPGSSLFVYPYLPVATYLLRANNPISYSYLQPGMMSDQDEARVHQDLMEKKPQFVLKQFFSDVETLTIWPNSDRNKMRFPSIDEWIETRYEFIEEIEGSQFILRAYRLRQ